MGLTAEPADPPAFTEGDIRPPDLMEEQASRFASDMARLLEGRSQFVDVDCPACDAKERRSAFEKMGFSFSECLSCLTVFVTPRPQPAQLEEYYETSENYRWWAEHIFPASEAVRRARIFRPRVERVLELCRRHGVPQGTLVEVGAGFGTFCEELASTGGFHRILAIEPTPGLAASCRQRGLEVIESRVEDVDLDTLPAVDVVVSFETIEHLFRPSSLLDACHRMVKPGGLLVLSCPNGRGFDVVVLGAGSDTVDPEHLNYFNPASLGGLAARSGFEVVEVLTPGVLDAELVRKKALSGEWDPSSQPFLRQVLVEEWDVAGAPFQDFLARAGLSSHMWMVARRLPA